MANAQQWFISDVADRVANRVQLTSDGHKAYLEAVEGAFGADIDYAMLVKIYGGIAGQRQGPLQPRRMHRRDQDPDRRQARPGTFHTSYSERSNLTMRMHNRRFTRLTNAFSKKFENHAHMVAIYAVWYNWIRIHKTLRVTPAMAAGLSRRSWIGRISWKRWTRKRRAKKRGPYKKAYRRNFKLRHYQKQKQIDFDVKDGGYGPTSRAA